jgi:hypothetical protein
VKKEVSNNGTGSSLTKNTRLWSGSSG